MVVNMSIGLTILNILRGVGLKEHNTNLHNVMRLILIVSLQFYFFICIIIYDCRFLPENFTHNI